MTHPRFAIKRIVSTCLASFQTGAHVVSSQVFSKIKECIEGRVEADMVGGEGSQANHILDNTHTHIGIGAYVIDNRLRYVEVSEVGPTSTQ